MQSYDYFIRELDFLKIIFKGNYDKCYFIEIYQINYSLALEPLVNQICSFGSVQRVLFHSS